MKRVLVLTLGLLALGLAGLRPSTTVAAQGPWTTLFDAKNGLKGWDVVGDANWAVVDGNLQASKGSAAGYLVTPIAYGDFQITLDFWVTPDANSGVFIRCTDPKMISAMNAYEVNIFDMRPDQTYRTGAIVNGLVHHDVRSHEDVGGLALREARGQLRRRAVLDGDHVPGLSLKLLNDGSDPGLERAGTHDREFRRGHSDPRGTQRDEQHPAHDASWSGGPTAF